MTDQQPEALRRSELSNKEWLDKTEWVQKTSQPNELGKHRADVIKQRIDRLLAENEQLRLYASGADMLVGVWKARAQEFMNSSDRLRAEMEAIGAAAEREACATIDVTPLHILASDGPGTAILKYRAAIRARGKA
ncbi:hypothetical protein [Malikia sp.]|uniref:hypothetical protein n=1 Tax=Malikia sp. TaxID=2070706 RepID=UPI002612C61E|nr:hypothetical protein [Malikia sp.]MDD2728207.1 hypothetical protein [Malikia sp.]